MSFQYEAMVPVERIPEGRVRLTPEIRFGRTPDGKAYRFVHKGPYDDIDSTYESLSRRQGHSRQGRLPRGIRDRSHRADRRKP
jgi:hypothetical protein